MDQSLHGKLGSFKLPDILTFLNISRKTGMLTLTHRSRNVAIHFDSGAIIYASSNQKRFRLGKVLLHKKRIGPDEARRIESLMLEQGEKYGRVAVKEKILTDEELKDFLKIQVSEILYDAFVWEEGMFQFQDDRQLPDYAVTISVDLPNLIMEGARRIDEWGRCQQLLPNSSMVFRVIPAPETQERISLTLAEWKIVFLIDGQRSLGDLCDLSEEEPLEVYRVVYGLLANKLIEQVTAADLMGTALLALEQKASETVPTGDMPTGSLNDDTGLLVSAHANLLFRDVMRVRMARLIVKETGDIYPLENEEYLIGRTASSHICLPDTGVSGIHARLLRSGDEYVLEDLNSRNGTFVNGERIDQRVMQENDRIRVGSSELVFNIVSDVKLA